VNGRHHRASQDVRIVVVPVYESGSPKEATGQRPGPYKRDQPAPWPPARAIPRAARARRWSSSCAAAPSKRKPCASCSSPTPLNAGMVEHRPSRLLESRYGSHCDLAACWANGGRALGGESLALGQFCLLFPDRGLGSMSLIGRVSSLAQRPLGTVLPYPSLCLMA
jgi:hypothetical protein